VSEQEKLLRRQAWDMYFASLSSMNLHPGMTRDGAERLSWEACARIADEMVAQRDLRMARGDL
jgi:hypothetical protein